MRVRVTKGGWFWKGEIRNTGDILDAPSAEWIANRKQDDLVEEIAEPADADASVGSAEVSASRESSAPASPSAEVPASTDATDAAESADTSDAPSSKGSRRKGN